MKRVEFKYVLVLIAIAAMVTVFSGCPQAKAPDSEIIPEDQLPEGEANLDEGAPADDGGATVAIPDSVETFGEAMKAFNMPTSFEMAIESSDEDTPGSMIMKMDGAEMLAMRMEMDGDVMLFNMSDKVMYMYDVEENKAMKMPVGEDDGDTPNLYGFYQDDLKVSGSETVDGVDCWVIDGIDDANAPGKVWVGKADGLMRQAQDDDEMIKFTYSRINEVPDSEFDLPEGVEVEDLGAMMESLGEMGEDTE